MLPALFFVRRDTFYSLWQQFPSRNGEKPALDQYVVAIRHDQMMDDTLSYVWKDKTPFVRRPLLLASVGATDRSSIRPEKRSETNFQGLNPPNHGSTDTRFPVSPLRRSPGQPSPLLGCYLNMEPLFKQTTESATA